MSLSGSYNHTQIKDPSLAVGVCAQCTVLDPLNATGQALIGQQNNLIELQARLLANLINTGGNAATILATATYMGPAALG